MMHLRLAPTYARYDWGGGGGQGGRQATGNRLGTVRFRLLRSRVVLFVGKTL